MDITAGNDFLGLSGKKKVCINVCIFLDSYGVTAAWNLE